MTVMDTLMGLGYSDLGLFLNRLVLGIFFLLARFRWFWDPTRVPEFFNPERHKHLANKLCTCGYHWHPKLSAAVATVEVFAGCALIVGLLTVPAAFGLLVILSFATYCTARAKVMAQSPVDRADCVSCYLWRVEGVYIVLAISTILMGPGKVSLDYLLLG